MSDIFALQGKAYSGKTQTINLIFQALCAKYPAAIVQNLSPNTNDIKAIISNINGYTVGSESQGDPNHRLQQSLQDFVRAKCDIIICATRTSGMTVNWVNACSAQYNVHFIAQVRTSPATYLASNSAMALNIIAQAGL